MPKNFKIIASSKDSKLTIIENHSKKFMNFGNSTTFEVPMHVTGVQPLATHTSAFLKFCKEYYKIGFSNLHGWATVDARSERNCVEEYMLIDPDCVSLIEPTLTENEISQK
jgi:hypothetical protein